MPCTHLLYGRPPAGLLNFMDGFRWSPHDAPLGLSSAKPTEVSVFPASPVPAPAAAAAAVAPPTSPVPKKQPQQRRRQPGSKGSLASAQGGDAAEGSAGAGTEAGRAPVVPRAGALRANELSDAELAGALPAVLQVCVRVFVCVCM